MVVVPLNIIGLFVVLPSVVTSCNVDASAPPTGPCNNSPLVEITTLGQVVAVVVVRLGENTCPYIQFSPSVNNILSTP